MKIAPATAAATKRPSNLKPSALLSSGNNGGETTKAIGQVQTDPQVNQPGLETNAKAPPHGLKTPGIQSKINFSTQNRLVTL